MRLHGATPNYEHPNSFSGTQLASLPFLVFLRPALPRLLRWLSWAQMAAALTIVVTTGSRTGYVACCLWLALLVLRSRSKFKAIFLTGLGLLLVLPLVPDEYIERFQTILTQHDKEGESIALRQEIFRDAFSMFIQHPLGVGLGQFTAVRQAMFGRDAPAHDLYLEIANDLGIQGLIIFLGFVICALRVASWITADCNTQIERCRQRLEQVSAQAELSEAIAGHVRDLLTMCGTAQAVFHFLIIRLALGIFGHDYYEVYWWFAAGLLLALENLRFTANARTDHYCGPPVRAAARRVGPRALSS